MKKLKLNLDEIKVESFKTTDQIKAKQGTVIGHLPPLSGQPETCENTCGLETLGMCTYQMWICYPNTAAGQWDTCYSPECQ